MANKQRSKKNKGQYLKYRELNKKKKNKERKIEKEKKRQIRLKKRTEIAKKRKEVIRAVRIVERLNWKIPKFIDKNKENIISKAHKKNLSNLKDNLKKTAAEIVDKNSELANEVSRTKVEVDKLMVDKYYKKGL